MTEKKHELTSQPPGGQFLLYEAEDDAEATIRKFRIVQNEGMAYENR